MPSIGLIAGMLSLLPAALLLLTACPQAREHATAARSDRQPAAITLEAAAALPAGTAPKGASFNWLKTLDLYNVAAWYYPPPAPKVKGALAPTMLLLHMRGKDKSSWGKLPEKLVEEGYAVLAIDLRGHGETLNQQGQALDLNDLKDGDYQNMLLDVAAAHEFLASQRGVDPERLGIIGASIGANLGLLYCAKDLRVRTVVALSPGLDYRSLKPMPAMDAVDKRAIYLVASRSDMPSAQACTELSKSGDPDGVKSVRLFDGSAHGTDLFTAHPGFDDTIVTGWLLNTIPPRR